MIFELWTFDVESDRSANWAAKTAQCNKNVIYWLLLELVKYLICLRLGYPYNFFEKRNTCLDAARKHRYSPLLNFIWKLLILPQERKNTWMLLGSKPGPFVTQATALSITS